MVSVKMRKSMNSLSIYPVPFNAGSLELAVGIYCLIVASRGNVETENYNLYT
jgi:hypothetical protein